MGTDSSGMARRGGRVCLAGAALVAVVATAWAEDQLELVREVNRAVVEVRTDRDDSVGSGFVVDEKAGLVFTNFHVVNGATKCWVTFPADRNEKQYETEGFVDVLPEKNICLLKIVPGTKKLQACEWRSRFPTRGSPSLPSAPPPGCRAQCPRHRHGRPHRQGVGPVLGPLEGQGILQRHHAFGHGLRVGPALRRGRAWQRRRPVGEQEGRSAGAEHPFLRTRRSGREPELRHLGQAPARSVQQGRQSAAALVRPAQGERAATGLHRHQRSGENAGRVENPQPRRVPVEERVEETQTRLKSIPKPIPGSESRNANAQQEASRR